MPVAGDEENWQELGATRVVDPPTHSPDLTPVQPIAVPHHQPATGTMLGDYQLMEKLGEGAMGAVYRARQVSFNRIVALKVLFSHVASHPRLVERLYREGRVLGQLDHPNIIQAYGVGEVQGCHYVAMEFVEGQNLQSWLRKLGRLSIPDAINITLAVARALKHAHDQGIIHRDIKPENIMLTPAGQVKVADLGMAKTEDEDMALTQTGHAIGTPWYMPLEQARNAKDIDARSDIFSLGCVLYCLITGTPPFTGRTLVDVIKAKEQGTFPTARSVNSEVPERLDLILCKMTAKLPKHRYANCTELIRDLTGLQLAGVRLSFLARPEGLKNLPSQEETVRAGKTLREAPKADPNLWYVKVANAAGENIVRKMTTEQMRASIESGQIQPTAPASRTPKDGFRALTTYKEFTSVLGKVAKVGADEATSKYRQLYKKIEKESDSKDEPVEKHAYTRHSPFMEGVLMLLPYGLAALVIAGVVAFLGWIVKGLVG